MFSHRQFVGFLLCAPFYCMLGLLIIEAALAALTTWLVIQAGQDLANEDFLIADFGWIVFAQSTSYVVGAVSWVYAERAGFGAFGRYMLRFARENRTDARLFGDTHQREKVEPFLTNETFHIFFELVYELEADLKLFFSLIFNTRENLSTAADSDHVRLDARTTLVIFACESFAYNFVSYALLIDEAGKVRDAIANLDSLPH